MLNVCEGSQDSGYCMSVLVAAESSQYYMKIAIVSLGIITLLGAAFIALNKKPAVHKHEKHVHNYPESTNEKIRKAILGGFAFGSAAFVATTIFSLAKRAFFLGAKKVLNGGK